MKKKLEIAYYCWLIINENNQPLYGHKGELWIFLDRKSAEEYIEEEKNEKYFKKSKKERYIVKVMLSDESNFVGNKIILSNSKNGNK